MANSGTLEEHGVQVIGVQVDAIKRGEDRQAFKDTMDRLGIDTADIAYFVLFIATFLALTVRQLDSQRLQG